MYEIDLEMKKYYTRISLNLISSRIIFQNLIITFT